MDIDKLKRWLRERGNYALTSMPPKPSIESEALDAIEALQRENEVLRHKCEQARARLDFSVKILTRIHSFITPADVTLPDGRRFEFNNPAIEHEMLKALSAAIRAVPDELMKAGSTQPERVSDDGY